MSGPVLDATIEGLVLEPRKLEVADDAELAALIRAVEVFARDLVNPPMLAVSNAGHLDATGAAWAT